MVNKRHVANIVKLGITTLAVTYLLSSGKLRLSQLAIKDGGWKWIAMAGLLCLLFMVICQIRLWILLRGGEVRVGLARVMKIGFITSFFNATLLGGFGFATADAIKAGYLLNEEGRRSKMVCAILLDRVVGMSGLITLAIFALEIGWDETVQSVALRRFATLVYALVSTAGLSLMTLVTAITWGRVFSRCLAVLAGGIAAYFLGAVEAPVWTRIAVVVFPYLAAVIGPSLLPEGRIHSYVRRRIFLGRYLMALVDATLAYRHQARRVAIAFVISIVNQFNLMLAIFCVALAISVPVEPTIRQVWFAAPISNLVSILPLPGNGLGFGEAAFESMLAMCADSNGESIRGGATIYFGFRLVITILGLAGLPMYLSSHKKRVQESDDSGDSGLH
ncbi:MAG: lysylphosphatidylglycerol synthase domain-containing protein [Verrucomicrobiota bacterium]